MTWLQEVVTFLMVELFAVSVVVVVGRWSQLTRRDMLVIWLLTLLRLACFAFLFLAVLVVQAVGP